MGNRINPLLGPPPFLVSDAVQWSQAQLAAISGIGLSTVRRMETSEGRLRGTADNVWKVQNALETAGVVFTDQNEESGPGVRLKDPM